MLSSIIINVINAITSHGMREGVSLNAMERVLAQHADFVAELKRAEEPGDSR